MTWPRQFKAFMYASNPRLLLSLGLTICLSAQNARTETGASTWPSRGMRAEQTFLPGEAFPSLTLLSDDRPQPLLPRPVRWHEPWEDIEFF